MRATVSSIPKGSNLIDIGCDHGKISVAAVLEGRANRVIATDISELSLDKTRRLAELHNLSDRIDTRVGDGLNVINEGEGDTLLIAGMGAREIKDILHSSSVKFEMYIFVPHQDTSLLREYLQANNYFIISDNKIKSKDKYYDIIQAKQGKCFLTYKQVMLGSSAYDNNDYCEYLQYEYQRVGKLIGKLPESDDRYKYWKDYYDLISEVINDKG